LYPAVALLEATNVSVGRGTDAPFEQVGAPWIEGEAWREALAREDVPGVEFVPTSFVPREGPFAGEVCRGVRVRVAEPRLYAAVRTGVTMAQVLLRLHGSRFRADAVERLLGHKATMTALRALRPWRDIVRAGERELTAFAEKREKFLLYGRGLEGACASEMESSKPPSP
jgi:uncharacterized protein YbbC (DUF1343 family)